MSRLHEERRHLTTMVRLMIEEMGDGMPERKLVHGSAS